MVGEKEKKKRKNERVQSHIASPMGIANNNNNNNETGSRSPCMRPRSDPPKMKNSTPDNRGGKKKNNEANWMVSNSA